MTDHYPLPSHAAYIWIAGGKLFIGLPPASEDSRTHTFAIPIEKISPVLSDFGTPVAANRGLAVLLRVLQDRAIAASQPRIGERGGQPKRMLENAIASDEKYREWLDAMTGRKAEKAAERAEAEELLKEVGL